MPIKELPIISLCVLVLVISSAGCLGTKEMSGNKTVPPSVLIDYRRSGGTEQVNDRLVIFTNGAAIISQGSSSSEISLNSSDLSLISVLMNESQFSEFQANYPATSQSVNVVTYTIDYGGKSVTAQETDIPPSLEVIIENLNRYFGSNSNSRSIYPTLALSH